MVRSIVGFFNQFFNANPTRRVPGGSRSFAVAARFETLESRRMLTNDLAPLNDEFDNSASLSSWQSLYQTEGWGADQLEVLNINQSQPGRLVMQPHTSTWYQDYRGAMEFKNVTGDFVFTSQVVIRDRDDVGDSDADDVPDDAQFSLGGIMIRTPRAITNPATDWSPGSMQDDGTNNGENYVFLSLGYGTTGGFSTEVKTTRNSNSQLELTPVNSGTATLRIARVGNAVITLLRLPNQDWSIVRRYSRPDMPATMQVGFVTYTDWTKASDFSPFFQNSNTLMPGVADPTPGEPFNPDLIAGFEYARFARPQVPTSLAGVDLVNAATHQQLLSFLGGAPTDLILSNSVMPENQPAGTTVGTLASDSLDLDASFTYALVAGTGSTDNSRFQISGNSLRTTSNFDFETQQVHTVRIRSTDQTGLFTEKVFTINVTNVNETPTDLSLTNGTVAENQPIGTTVGTFSTSDPDTANSFTYTLANGAGSADNGSFQIVGGTLRTATMFDFETRSSYSIRVRSTDQGGLSFEKVFAINVTNVSDGPTDIILSSTQIAEGLSIGTEVGTFSTVDPSSGNLYTYVLVSGAGSADNAQFQISGESLLLGASFDFETKPSYSIRVRSTSFSGLSIEKIFTIAVSNVNETPTDLALNSTTIFENQPTGTLVGTLSTTDPDVNDSFIYALISGIGGTDNASFQITGNTLRTAVSFDFESQSSYSIRVRGTDLGGLSVERVLAISVTNVNETPTDVSLSSAIVEENRPIGTLVGMLSTVDPDTVGPFTYALVGGVGSTDNSRFQITGHVLHTATIFDFETQSSFSIRIRGTDQGGMSIEKIFLINVTNVNETPTKVELSSTTVLEHQPAGTAIGMFTTADPDSGDTFNYTLVGGVGAADNSSFQIVGDSLQTTTSIDFETKSSFSIRVRSTDLAGLSLENVLTISVQNVNEAPVDIGLTSTTVVENHPAGTTVGTLTAVDPDLGDALVYTLVDGVGSAGNANFQITGNSLRTADSFDFETETSFSIRVRVADSEGLFVEKIFTIQVEDLNDFPTDILLTSMSVAENRPQGTFVGTFSTVADSPVNTFMYSLVSGAGDADNELFQISGTALQTASSLDYEARSIYSIRVRSTDIAGFSVEKSFTIGVTNLNEAPTEVILSSLTIAENEPNGTAIGEFSTLDPDVDQSFTYSLVSGAGSSDNSHFQINGTTLRTVGTFDFEAGASYSIRVRSTDQSGLSFARAFVVNVTDADEPPTDFSLGTSIVSENQPVGLAVGTLTTDDPDSGGVFTYALVGGAGSEGNSHFSIVGDTLQTASSFDFETESTYSIRVRSTDQAGLFLEKILSVSVSDVNEVPTDLMLTSDFIAELQQAGAVVGQFVTIDPDTGNSFTYALVGGLGSEGNAEFQIDGNSLLSTASFDFETQPSHSIRVRVTDQSGLFVDRIFLINVMDVNESPIVTAIEDQLIAEEETTGALTFQVGDPETDVNSLVVQVTSNHPELVPNSSLILTGAGADWTVTVNPLPDQSGTTTITILVSDGVNVSMQSFDVIVVPVNDAPGLSSISPQSILEDQSTGTLSFVIGDSDSPIDGLTVTATSSNTALIANSGIAITGTGLDRGLVLTPAANQNGTTEITVTVSDGVLTSSQTFLVTVIAVDDPPELAISPTPLVYRASSRRTVPLDDGLTIADEDSPTLNFSGSIFEVSGQSSKDKLSILNQGKHSVKGKKLLFDGTAIGSWGGGKKGAPLVISLNSNATPAAVQTLIRAIGFKTTKRSLGQRTLQFQFTNLSGASTPRVSRRIEVEL